MTSDRDHAPPSAAYGVALPVRPADVAAVVVSYQSAATIDECLLRLRAAEGIAQIRVVDNGSTDGTLAIVQRHAAADWRVRFIGNPDNPGFAVACNQGAADSDAAWIAFINPDCLVQRDTLARLRAHAGAIITTPLNRTHAASAGAKVSADMSADADAYAADVTASSGNDAASSVHDTAIRGAAPDAVVCTRQAEAACALHAGAGEGRGAQRDARCGVVSTNTPSTCRLQTDATRTHIASAPGSDATASETLNMQNDCAADVVLGADLVDVRGVRDAAARRRDPDFGHMLAVAIGRAQPRAMELPADDAQPLQPVEAISGALMLMPRRLFRRIGGFDEAYRLHAEDLDLCRRARQAGATVAVANDVRVVHIRGVSSQARPLFVEWHKHRGLWRYFRLFEAPQRSAFVCAAVWAAIWLRFPLAVLRASLRGRPPS